MTKILVIDDYKEICDLFKDVLEKAGYEVDITEESESGVKKILEGGYDLILLDLLMPEKNGIWVLKEVKNKVPKNPNGKIVLMGLGDDKDHKDLINEALANGASGFLDKRKMVECDLMPEIDKYLQK